MNRKVLVALSGGVDSAVTACLLKERGYEVLGVYFILSEPPDIRLQENLNFISDSLGIGLIYHDARSLFHDRVIKYTIRMHRQGHTPGPCTICNPRVKWHLLATLAEMHQCRHLSTGHYARIGSEGGRNRIYLAKDRKKDQSYYLWGLSQVLVDRTLFPLGEFTKTEVKALAGHYGLEVLISEKESTGLCFAGQRSYAELIETHWEGPPVLPGEVVDRAGVKIGSHRGYIYYTIGQKKDLFLENKQQKLCVAEIDAVQNRIVADSWQNLYRHDFTIRDGHFYSMDELHSGIPIQTRIRGFGVNPAGNTRITSLGGGTYSVQLEEAAWAITTGQPAVFYSGELLLGGGIVV